MDPKKVSDLDPKLKEVYERVMGTKVTGTEKPVPSSPQITQPVSPVKTSTPQAVPNTVQVFTSQGDSSKTTTEAKKGGSPVLSIVLILAGLIFFVIYALFWVRFFNVNLPFTFPF